MKLRKITSGIMAAIMVFSVVGTPVGDIFPEVSKKISASAAPEETALVKASADRVQLYGNSASCSV